MTSPAPLSPAPEITEEDRLRADLYGFLSALLAGPPDRDLLARTAALTGDDSPLGRAIATLATLAAAATPRGVDSEYTRLFIGLGRGELLPYASFYLTGFLHEKPLVQLRLDMQALRVARAPGKFEPEDNIATLCEIMAGLIRGDFAGPVPLARQQEFFNRHIAPWAGHFFSDLEAAKASVFYAPVGTVGRIFVGIERESFRIGGD